MEPFLKNNNVGILTPIPKDRYENLFRVYKFINNNKEFYYYNITNKLNLPEKIDPNIVSTAIFDYRMPLTLASYKIYGTTNLWYILYTLNTTTSKARFFVEPGEKILFINVEFLNYLLNSLDG